jgi:ArsR family transcriptional regulator
MTAATTDAATAAAELFKALAHPTRVAILEVLRHGEECVCHMEAILGKRQAYISQQLAILRATQIIIDRRDGLNMFYRVVRPEVFAVLDAARALNPMAVTAPPATIQMEACPCPKCSPVARAAD